MFTNNDTALGMPGATVVDSRQGRLVVDTIGEDRLEGVVLDDGSKLPCDVLAVSGGWSPAVHLWTQRGGRLRYDERSAAFVPDGGPAGVEVVGKAAGRRAARRGAAVARPAATRACRSSTSSATRRSQISAGRVGAGLRSIEHVKRYTTIGTGSEQGKTAGVNAIGVAAQLLGLSPAELGTTTFRPPYVPVPFALLAGRDRGPLFDPVRVTPIHPWHVARGAVFENVGQWKRPRYYPQGGESMDEAVLRECAAARERVAAMDASTLGKIDVQGPDAAELLNRLYTNAYDTLAVGKCRYGVMCKPDGMVFDDGVVMRVGEERYLCTTTTGNAAPVLAWMEEWLQTEWPELRVWLTSVTEQWATVAVVGPDSRALLGRADRDPARQRELPLHGDPRGRGRRDPGASLPHQLLGGARLRGERRRPPRPRALGGRDGERRGHAVRDRGDARSPGREGLPDHRPGDRRHRHAAGSGHELDRLDDEAGLPGQALVLACGHGASGPQAPGRPAPGRRGASSFPRARSWSPTPVTTSRSR